LRSGPWNLTTPIAWGGIYSGDYADSAHDHDDRYYTQGELNTAGSLNDTGNPVDWTKLKNVPGGLADGTDDTGPGDGYSLDAADGNPVDAVYVDNDGDVGIGTTSPTADLHLRGSNPKVLIDATGDDSEIQFKSSGDGAAQVWTVYKDSATDDLRFNQNGDKVTIDNSTGNVGIGTTSPSAGKLQVQSSGDAVYAKSSGSTGIFAVAGTAVGGEADGAVVGTSTTRSAVIGYSTGGAGVVGHSSGATIPAVAGYHSGDGPAIYGSCSGAYPCLEGSRTDAGTVVGAYGNDGVAVLGYTSSASGIPVVGYQTGYTTADIGSWWKPGGYFAGRNGVVGLTNEPGGYAVLGISKNTNSWAGVFMGDGNGVAISTPGGKTGLTVSGGSKAAVVATADGARSLYCEEASEVWFADYGFGRLEDGLAVIAIDPVFAETVNLGEPYHVFLQAYGDADLYVSSRDEHTFEVRLRDGDPAAEFSYRLVAKRLGYEVERLTRVPWADNDANLFPGRAAHLQGED